MIWTALCTYLYIFFWQRTSQSQRNEENHRCRKVCNSKRWITWPSCSDWWWRRRHHQGWCNWIQGQRSNNNKNGFCAQLREFTIVHSYYAMYAKNIGANRSACSIPRNASNKLSSYHLGVACSSASLTTRCANQWHKVTHEKWDACGTLCSTVPGWRLRQWSGWSREL